MNRNNNYHNNDNNNNHNHRNNYNFHYNHNNTKHNYKKSYNNTVLGLPKRLWSSTPTRTRSYCWWQEVQVWGLALAGAGERIHMAGPFHEEQVWRCSHLG